MNLCERSTYRIQEGGFGVRARNLGRLVATAAPIPPPAETLCDYSLQLDTESTVGGGVSGLISAN